MLIHFDLKQSIILEIDVLTYILDAVVFQLDSKGIIYCIIFRSRKFNAAELNYNIYDQQMLAIIYLLEYYHQRWPRGEVSWTRDE